MDPNQQPQLTPDQPEEFNSSPVQPEPLVQPEYTQSSYNPAAEVNQQFSQSTNPTSATQPVVEPSQAPVFAPVPVVASFPAVVPLPVATQAPAPPVNNVAVKKNRLWIWIALGVAIAVLVGLLITFFVARNSGDTTAKAYTTESQSYLDDVYDAAVGSADDPATIKKDIDAIKTPVLKSTFLSVASGKYAVAETLSKDVKSKVTVLTDKVNGNAQYYTFYSDYLDLYDELNDIYIEGSVATFSKSTTGVKTFMANFGDKLDELNKLADDAVVPSESAADVKEFGRVYGEIATAWSQVAAAYNSGNRDAYDVASDKYTNASDGLDAAKKPIVEYYNDLSSKTKDAAKDLQTFSKTIK